MKAPANSIIQLIIVALALSVLLIAPLFGSVSLDRLDPTQSSQVFWQLRVPRVLLGFLAGGALAACGAVYQGMFRNPLACPFTVGVASGAMLAAALALRCEAIPQSLGISFVVLAGFFGAALTILAIVALSTAAGGGSYTLLLAGMVASIFCASILLLLQYISDLGAIFKTQRLFFGAIDPIGLRDIEILFVIVVPAFFLILRRARDLDLMQLGSEFALSRGVNVRKSEIELFLATSLLVGAVTALTGPVAFVGLIVPHVVRPLIRGGFRVILPIVFVAGGLFLVICDTLARSILAPIELPVGIVTAFIGAPFFVFILLRKRVITL